MVFQHFLARRLVEGAPSLIIEGKGNLCQIGDGRQRGPGPVKCACFQLVVERHRHAQAAVHIQSAQVSVFFRGVGAAETAHDAAVGLNDIVIADVVCLGTATGAIQTVQVTEQHARIDCHGRLIAPFSQKVATSEAFHLVYPTHQYIHPHAEIFRSWIVEEATASRERLE